MLQSWATGAGKCTFVRLLTGAIDPETIPGATEQTKEIALFL
jgi:ABC-type polysaccharide/polyol phosphate transport system ATPase subunit